MADPTLPASPKCAHEDLGEPLLEVRDVSFGYGPELVLEGVNLAIYPRDYLAILGPNGGGKSTLLRLLVGDQPLQLRAGVFQ